MSLIQDALDRAERMRGRPVASPPVDQKPKPEEKKTAAAAAIGSVGKQITAIHAREDRRFWVRNLILLSGFFCFLLGVIFLSRFLRPVVAPAAPAADISPVLSETPAPAVMDSGASTLVVKQTHGSFLKREIRQTRYILTGITASEGQPLAVINNQVVGVGDRMREGAIVRKIGNDRVIIEVDGQKLVLFF